MRTLFRFTRRLLIGLFAFYIVLFGVTRVIHYPEPIAAIRLGLAPASKTPTLMPFHIVKASTAPAKWEVKSEPMPATVEWNGASINWATFLSKTSTNAFLVIRDGVITYEWYNKATTAKSKLPSYSVAKTLTSIMIGQLVSAGKISESDTFVKFFPQWKTGGDFDKVTIKTLLDMQAGVAVSDNYPTGPSGWGVGIAQMYATTDLNFFMQHNRKMSWAPGTNSEYRSVDTQMLGFIIKRVTGMSVVDYFGKNVWQPIGAADSAYWNVDHVGGLEKTFCCFNATARDYARVGQLILNDNGNVISADWLKRLTTPVTTLDHDWGYGAQAWHPFNGVTMLLGLHGQYVLVYPATNTVIVKLSDEPTDSGNDEVLTVNVLQSLVSAKL
ncbi:MAG: serine hydrolase [Actinobacteria bacterium]|nr:serine hydrolase [Actinomycetota bacterium]